MKLSKNLLSCVENCKSQRTCQWSELELTNGREFHQDKFNDYYDKNGISHNFSAPRIPQQNGVIESKHGTLGDMSKNLICKKDLPKSLWAILSYTFSKRHHMI